eukprot:1013573-Amphidinium_carterae.1
MVSLNTKHGWGLKKNLMLARHVCIQDAANKDNAAQTMNLSPMLVFMKELYAESASIGPASSSMASTPCDSAAMKGVKRKQSFQTVQAMKDPKVQAELEGFVVGAHVAKKQDDETLYKLLAYEGEECVLCPIADARSTTKVQTTELMKGWKLKL